MKFLFDRIGGLGSCIISVEAGAGRWRPQSVGHSENLVLGFIRNEEKSLIGFKPVAWVLIRKNKMIRRKKGGESETIGLVVDEHQTDPLFRLEIVEDSLLSIP